MPGCKEIQHENESSCFKRREAVPSGGEGTAALPGTLPPGLFLSQLQQIRIPSGILHIPHVYYLTKSISLEKGFSGVPLYFC